MRRTRFRIAEPDWYRSLPRWARLVLAPAIAISFLIGANLWANNWSNDAAGQRAIEKAKRLTAEQNRRDHDSIA